MRHIVGIVFALLKSHFGYCCNAKKGKFFKQKFRGDWLGSIFKNIGSLNFDGTVLTYGNRNINRDTVFVHKKISIGFLYLGSYKKLFPCIRTCQCKSEGTAFERIQLKQ